MSHPPGQGIFFGGAFWAGSARARFPFVKDMKRKTPNSDRPSRRLIFESMAACAAATGYPIHALKDAKRLGCPAFHGSRVHLLEFVLWMNSRAPEAASENWSYRLERAQALRAEQELEEARAALVASADVRATMDEITRRTDAALTAKFVDELPQRVAGRATAEIATEYRAALRHVRETLASPEFWADAPTILPTA